MAVIRAFLDESGTNPETPVICVAGSYGKRDQWKKFKDVWKSHSVGFHALKSSALFGTIVNAMDAAQIESILVSVSKETYKTYASSHFKTALGNAYSACALNCAAQICKYIEPNKGSFVLESGQPNLEFVQHILEYMMNSGEWCISAVAKAKKEDFIELHCADFVSHICSSHDKLWMGRLFELGLLRHAHLTIKDLEDSSAHATMAFQKSKTVRKALKQMQSEPSEFENFNRTMTQLMSVPHHEIQAALEAERMAKAKKKRRKAKKPSASGRAANGGG